MTGCKEIDGYIEIVRSGAVPVCKEQILLCDLVEAVFAEENLTVDGGQLEKYLDLQKYFTYKLFEWEKFCFALHNCVYDKDGQLRFPNLFINVGRGAGKNGYLSFEDFALLTPANGVKDYHIDIFAMSEDQAKASWRDVYDMLEANKKKMSKHFYWTKEVIKNLKTGSEFSYNTSRPQSKDGRRPGKVDFDEIHAYENAALIDVGVTGLGKKPHPRRTYITTNGKVRGGVFDDMLEKALAILKREKPDNGTLPFICRLDDEKEIDVKEMWEKANPSLRYFPALLREISMEYSDYVENPVSNWSFAAKRMNLPPKLIEGAVTSWENILATNQAIPEEALINLPCVGGIDYASTTDFVSAGLLYQVDDLYIFIAHTWVCRQSKDLHRIKAPLEVWEREGLLTFVESAEIDPEIPTMWMMNEAAKRNSKIVTIGIDRYRFTLMKKALLKNFFSPEKEIGNVKLIFPSDEMMLIPTITSGFINHRFVWGDNPLMRWATHNSKLETSSKGNTTYTKIEPKSRKTDPFKSFVAAVIVSPALEAANIEINSRLYESFDVMVFD